MNNEEIKWTSLGGGSVSLQFVKGGAWFVIEDEYDRVLASISHEFATSFSEILLDISDKVKTTGTNSIYLKSPSFDVGWSSNVKIVGVSGCLLIFAISGSNKLAAVAMLSPEQAREIATEISMKIAEQAEE